MREDVPEISERVRMFLKFPVRENVEILPPIWCIVLSVKTVIFVYKNTGEAELCQFLQIGEKLIFQPFLADSLQKSLKCVHNSRGKNNLESPG